MKYSEDHVNCKMWAMPKIRFEQQQMTSFAGLLIFQQFFQDIGFKDAISRGLGHINGQRIYHPRVVFLMMVIHVIIGFRDLQDVRFYQDDPMVKRTLRLSRLPSVSTISRTLGDVDERGVDNLRSELREGVLGRLQETGCARVTLDFDGSVISTRRKAEGTAVGYNKSRKGARSYYPLFCTVAQTGQVLDVLHRSGNVHDSRGAEAFNFGCMNAVKSALPGAAIEVRMDSAFFSDMLIGMLERAGAEYTISVPFERFPALKEMIEEAAYWRRCDSDRSYFEMAWAPKSWDSSRRFIFVRTKREKQLKGPVQLDLFIPRDEVWEYKVIVTNKTRKAKTVVRFHEGRGAQEGIFGELKSQCQMDNIPCRKKTANQTYLLANLFAHNLVRELQMQTNSPQRQTTLGRATLWTFEKLETLRHGLIQRAGRFTRPQGALSLTISAGAAAQKETTRLITSLRGDAEVA